MAENKSIYKNLNSRDLKMNWKLFKDSFATMFSDMDDLSNRNEQSLYSYCNSKMADSNTVQHILFISFLTKDINQQLGN